MSNEEFNENGGIPERFRAKTKPEDFLAKPNPRSHVRKVIAVVSGKGGVGKSLVTGLTAVLARRRGFATAIMDADITGPSIPRMFGVGPLDLSVDTDGKTGLPAETATGINVVSMNLLMDNEEQPVIWRAPVITGAVQQFWTDFAWGDVDYMFVDMPPGTGDVPLTVFQALPVDGVIIVSTPQDLVGMIVQKAVGMAKLMNKPILGLVENMSYVKCPHCGEKISLFGESHVDEIAEKDGLTVLAKLPMDPEITALCDVGQIEYSNFDEKAVEGILNALPKV